MNHAYALALVGSLAIAAPPAALAQDTLAYTSFAEGLGGWTATDLSAAGSGDTWGRGDGPTAGRFPLPALRSTSGANGFAVFDADAQCGGSQNARLASPVLDLSAAAEVEVRWQHLYRRFASAIYIEVSVDGGRTFGGVELAPALPDGGYVGTETGTAVRAAVDLTDVAAGEDSVVIAFRYYSEPALFGADAGCGYAWLVDDVAVATAVTPPPAVDLALARVAPPQNFATPAGRGGAIAWYAEVANRGAAAQAATVELVVTPTGGDAVVFSTETEAFDVPAGAVVATPPLPPYPLPKTPGDYTATYRLAGLPDDANPVDNEVGYRFLVTDSTYLKTPGVTSFARPRGNGSFSMGTVFDLGAGGARLDSIRFAVDLDGATSAASTTLTVTTYGYRGDLDGDGELAPGDELVELGSRAVLVSRPALGGSPILATAPTLAGSLEIDTSYRRFAVLVTTPRVEEGAATRVSLGVYDPGRDYDFGLLERRGGADGAQAIARIEGGGLRIGGFDGLVPAIGVTVGEGTVVGTAGAAIQPGVRLWPNPATETATISLPTGSRGAAVALVGYDGRPVRTFYVGPGSTQLDLRGLPGGMYTAVVDELGEGGLPASVRLVIAR